ncbi:MAG: GNAT family N-acetyltransferase [Saprospiraceae bacterium]|nr:GNAT family N-acetyltransferase [Saprospiraceae bacterium]
MTIQKSTIQDIDTIFNLYDEAIAFQKTVFEKAWEGFERSLVELEVSENRQWKIIIDNEIACIFAITFSDVEIWRERTEPSVFIHRIVTNAKFRGRNFVLIIIEWAKEFCKKNDLEFIRIDTWGDNPRLVEYYIKCGFTFIDTIDVSQAKGLPKHYRGILARLEIKI